MVQLPDVSESATRDAHTATPIDGYELVDFGNGRKLERWGDYLIESPDRGAYGIEDTRQALIEARRDGIHSFCITIDTEARDYLPHMYGAVNYAVIDEVRKLPLKVSDIYRRLTT